MPDSAGSKTGQSWQHPDHPKAQALCMAWDVFQMPLGHEWCLALCPKAGTREQGELPQQLMGCTVGGPL